MSDNEGGDAAAEVDFNDDLFTCANVRLFAHAAYLFIYRFKTLSLSLSSRFFFFCCSVARGSFDIFATGKAASSPSLTLLFLLLLLPFTTRNNYKHSQMSSPSTRLLPIA